jgi:hypothetical protein
MIGVRSMPAPGFSRRSAIAALAAAGFGLACRAPGDDTRPILSLDVIAERYVRLTLEFAQHQPSLVEGWFGPPEWRPGPRRPVAQLRDELDALRAAMPASSTDAVSEVRRRYLRQQVDALWVAGRRLAGESMQFIDEARAAFGDEVANLVQVSTCTLGEDTPERSAAYQALNERLSGRGPLHERYTSFRNTHAIAKERVLSTCAAAMEICRREVVQHIPIPNDASAEMVVAQGLGLQARASYAGGLASRVQIDPTGGLDLARLVWVVAHETYPGHHVQHVLAARDLVQSQKWHERALQPSFGTHLLVGEGAAEAGAALLLDGVAFENICRELAPVAGVSSRALRDLIEVHRAVTELETCIVSVAQRYLDGAIGSEAAAEQLTTSALVPDAHQFLFTIERQRTRLLAYPVGRRMVSTRVFAESGERRWDRLAQISTWLTLPS